ncbi:MAG: 3-phosphoserine/phosphohydroxythreonine transaminase [Synergistaceae bacterium]|jgi:phosphoserine aminotransferase|nr:3-phosphoserine/phosphohydroxythreonine transaminase [Synergistaceae bacterium]
MDRVYNFGAGPAALPLDVLVRAQKEFLSYGKTGMSVLEISHRSKAFEEIIAEAEKLFRELLGIPDNYYVLFLQGGATLQFSMVPLNLMCGSKKADYVVSGYFAERAAEEARKFGGVRIAASSKEQNFACIPPLSPTSFNPEADYVHITSNNTIYGTRYTSFPNTGPVPLVADMSSGILSEVLDVSRFGVIYAGAQKNIGPAGLCMVIIRKDLAESTPASIPVMLEYRTCAEHGSLYNTPGTFSVYIAKLVFEWLKAKGGVAAQEKINREKAEMLYDCIDKSSLYKGTADREFRSLMNVTFVLPSEDLTAAFISEAAAAGLVGLKGHRAVGGIRVSLYNAVTPEAVVALCDFMKKFESAHKIS